MEEKEAAELFSSDNFIMFNNLRGKIVLWVNCEKEMAVKIDVEAFKKMAPSIFPGLNLPNLISLLNQGFYVYTDKKMVKPLRPNSEIDIHLIPSVEESLRARKPVRRTPYGFSFR